MTQTIDPLTAKIPLPSSPFLNPDGNVSREWLYLIITLLNRTGGSAGISLAQIQAEITTILGQIGGLGVIEAMSEGSAPPTSVPLDPFGVTPTNPDLFQTLLAEAMVAVPMLPRVNPFLASMVIG